MNAKKAFLGSAVVLYFVIAFEVLVMISPFAGFFYSLFDPVLLRLADHPPTRWLSAFFLPHMVLPADPLLQFIRVMGSVLFVLGVTVFSACAFQVYRAGIRRSGAVTSGLYSGIRHPQYLSLMFAGLGLTILWPRFLSLVLWFFMTFVYYFLAKDEERRMLKAHLGTYKAYRNRSGMFLPLGMEKRLTPSSASGKAVFALALAALVIGGAFLLRAYTVRHLTLWTDARNVTAVAILPEDGFKMEHRMSAILGLEEVRGRLQESKQHLVYFLPRDYVMQGMIADTGGDWKLYEHHRSAGLIADWIFNPFGHLREGRHAMHGEMQTRHGVPEGSAGGVVRRLIFLSVENGEAGTPSGPFAINAVRTPRFMLDVDVHNLRVLEIRALARGSGWGSVPTPVF